MEIGDIRNFKEKLYQIASKNGITKIYVVGSVAHGGSDQSSDIDFLIEMDEDASAFGVGAFQYEAQNLIGVEVHVIPRFALLKTDDEFVRSVKENAIPL
ncbi:MAG: nucleotidyltransferase domain-containing protein [Anaerolineales bacterium]